MLTDLLSLSLGALRSHRLRSLLSMLGIAIGVASVVLLTSVGEGTRRFMIAEFSQFGTNLLAINPGKAQTFGVPGVLGGTTHKLTLDDAVALFRVPGVEEIVPLAFGTARVEANGRGRSVYVYGVTPAIAEGWKFRPRQGRFWPDGDLHRGYPMAVLGTTLGQELFDERNPLGQRVRIGGSRFRVVGVMEPKGTLLGIDLDDSAYIPVASALRLYNLAELSEIDVLFASARMTDSVVEGITRLLAGRHRGREDFTVTSQAAMLEVFDNVMGIITLAVGAIAAISLFVGAIGILTMM